MATVLLGDAVSVMRIGLANAAKSHAFMVRMKVAMERACAANPVTTALAATFNALATACAVRMGHASVITTMVMVVNTAISRRVPVGRSCVRDVENACQRACVHADQGSAATPVRLLTVPVIQIVKDFQVLPAVL